MPKWMTTRPSGRATLKVDNFKFMDSWPAWVRWLLVIAAANLLPLVWLLAFRVFGDNWIFLLACLILGTAGAIWCSVSTAPNSKMGITLAVGVIVLIFAYSDYLKNVRASLDPTQGVPLALVSGVLVAWGFILWGYFRRRRALSSR